MFPLSFSEFMTVYDGNRCDGWNEYVTYGGIPIVVLAGTEDQKLKLLDNLLEETYIQDIVKRHKIRNVGEMETLLDILASRYDIKGKSYIGTPMKYYFMDMGLRNARINYRQQEVTHAMENVIYNELRVRGFKVDIGNLNIVEKGEDGKKVKKQLEVDFICRKGSKRYYIQSAYMLPTEEEMLQEIRPFLKINDSFKKIIITSNTPKPFYDENGILMMNIFDFFLEPSLLEF